MTSAPRDKAHQEQREDGRRSADAAPVDAPLRLDLGDAGVLHVLEAQVFLQVGLVDADRHGHVAVAVQGGVSSARQPLATPPAETTAWERTNERQR